MNISNGDSIAINGACLTVLILRIIFLVLIYLRNYEITSFKSLRKGDFVNIEFPLTLNKFISGHITTGHIDTIGIIETILKDTDSWFIQIKIDKIYLKYIVHKGSICIDGISLTINQIQGNIIDLMVIPHTYQNTIIKNYSLGDSVNIEVDYIAKHLEKLKNG